MECPSRRSPNRNTSVTDFTDWQIDFGMNDVSFFHALVADQLVK
jgi:hypothetical protein